MVADFITVVATTDPEKGLKGLSLFLVDTRTAGFSVGRKLQKFTTHCCDSAELVLEDVAVPVECRLGDEDTGFLNAYLSLTIDRVFSAALADREAPITVEAALAKIVAADGANQICQKALNIFGGYGLMNEFPVQRFLRDSYFPMIGGGTSDIMRLLIARQLGF